PRTRVRRRRRRRLARAATSPLVLALVGLALSGLAYRLSSSPPRAHDVPGPGTVTTWPTVASVRQERTPPVPDSEAQSRYGPASSSGPASSTDTIPGPDPGRPDPSSTGAQTQGQPEDARATQPPSRGERNKSHLGSSASSGRVAGTRPWAAAPAAGRSRIEPPPTPPVPRARSSVAQRAVVPDPSRLAGERTAPQPDGVALAAPEPPTPSVAARAAGTRAVQASVIPVPPGAPVGQMGFRTDDQPSIPGAPPAGSPGGAASALVPRGGGSVAGPAPVSR